MFKPRPPQIVVPSASAPVNGAVRRLREAGAPFFGVLEPVVVESPAEFTFDGSIARDHLEAIWTWVVRDLAPGMAEPEPAGESEAVDALLVDLAGRMRKAEAGAMADPETRRRLSVQLGGEEVRSRLPVVLNALKCRGALARARDFGRAADAMTDDGALEAALQAMPIAEPAFAALLMHAALAEVHNPGRLVVAVTHIAGGTSDISVMRSGYGMVIEAILAHAQNQIPVTRQRGPFADTDLMCRAIDRFHRLIRSITANVELSSRSPWLATAGGLTRRISESVEPRLRDLLPDIGQAMRRHDPADRLDSDRIFAALGGCYLLRTVRDCRDSLALNTLIDQIWTQLGNALDVHVERNLSLLRERPNDPVIAARLEAAVKMAELRFGADYADIIRRARESAEKKLAEQDLKRRSG